MELVTGLILGAIIGWVATRIDCVTHHTNKPVTPVAGGEQGRR